MKLVEHFPNSHSMFTDAGEVDLLLISDVHFDSKDCDRVLLKKHFDQIKAKGGFIMCFGDWFDVMGCFRDPRSKGQDIRPEYLSQSRGYLDLIVEDSYNFMLPYAENLIFMGYGNHETSIIKHRDTDILNSLCFLLRQQGSNVVKGGYSGYFNLSIQDRGRRTSYLLAYHHGGGGAAPRSKGILHADIDAKNYPDADIIVSGHNHQKLVLPLVCYRRATQTGKIYHSTKYWVKTGNYKRNDHLPLIGGWHVEKKFDPTPIGGYFLNLKVEHDVRAQEKPSISVLASVIEAV